MNFIHYLTNQYVHIVVFATTAENSVAFNNQDKKVKRKNGEDRNIPKYTSLVFCKQKRLRYAIRKTSYNEGISTLYSLKNYHLKILHYHSTDPKEFSLCLL